jgi:hypothetical protein
MADKDTDFTELDALLDLARQKAPDLPAGLEQSILADAASVQAELQQQSRPDTRSASRPWWEQVLSVFGGAPALGGLGVACAVGVWVGLAPPAFLPDPVQMFVEVQAGSDVDLFGADDVVAFLVEE